MPIGLAALARHQPARRARLHHDRHVGVGAHRVERVVVGVVEAPVEAVRVQVRSRRPTARRDARACRCTPRIPRCGFDRARARRSGRASVRRASRPPPSGWRRARSRTGRACRGGRRRRWGAAACRCRARPCARPSPRARTKLSSGSRRTFTATLGRTERAVPHRVPVGRERVAEVVDDPVRGRSASALIAEPLQLGGVLELGPFVERARRHDLDLDPDAEAVLELGLDRGSRAPATSTGRPSLVTEKISSSRLPSRTARTNQSASAPATSSATTADAPPATR